MFLVNKVNADRRQHTQTEDHQENANDTNYIEEMHKVV